MVDAMAKRFWAMHHSCAYMLEIQERVVESIFLDARACRYPYE